MTETLTKESVQRTHDRRRRPVGPHYKWVALTNTTMGSLMATIDASIVLIAFPAIFKGIGINPLAPGEASYFLWLLLGYLVVTATLLVTFGRISDMFGRVRLYNLGFLIFAIGSTLLALTPGTGNTGALELIIFRLIQGIGSGFLLSNSAAILTDAFPANQRGRALGINQIAGIAGSFIGLIVGGILAAINWRLVFIVSVPVGIAGTIWAYTMLRETATIREHQKIDWLGNVTFALGLTVFLLGITYGIEPYGGSPTGLEQSPGHRSNPSGHRASGSLRLDRIAHRRPDVSARSLQNSYVCCWEYRWLSLCSWARWSAVYADYLVARHLASITRL